MSRTVRGLLVVLAVTLLTAAPAAADAAGPSNFRSEVTGLVPDDARVHAAVRGGDSFLQLTVEEGTNTLVGTSPPLLVGAVRAVLKSGGKRGRAPALWDGAAAERIAGEILAYLAREPAADTKSAAA